MWKRRHVASEKNLADFDSRLADEGLLTPGECLHPPQLLRRLSRDGRFRRDLGGTHPPALEPLPSFPEEIKPGARDCARSPRAGGGPYLYLRSISLSRARRHS